jgi:hypothetical protein
VGVQKIPSSEDALRKHAAVAQLKALVDAGCDRSEIVTLLDLAFLTVESWDSQIGMGLRDLKTALTEIRNCADIIGRLNRTEVLYRAIVEHRIPDFVSLCELADLPESLRRYASAVKWFCQIVGPKRRPRLLAWKAWIVAVVWESTNRPHDVEVASLIGAVLDDADYSAEVHKTWRFRHRALIQKSRNKVRDRQFGQSLRSIRSR